MGKIPIECCRGCKLRTECGHKYKGQFPPCHKIAVAASSTSSNTTKATICPECGGEGTNRHPESFAGVAVCPDCKGTGKL